MKDMVLVNREQRTPDNTQGDGVQGCPGESLQQTNTELTMPLIQEYF